MRKPEDFIVKPNLTLRSIKTATKKESLFISYCAKCNGAIHKDEIYSFVDVFRGASKVGAFSHITSRKYYHNRCL